MNRPATNISINLPEWLCSFQAEEHTACSDPESRMQMVIGLAATNIEKQTGGPFAAAIFDMDTHHLLAAGVNLVVPSSCSMAHAEMVAISLAQQKLGSFDLGAQGLSRYELVTSCEPCAMCYGAIPWSGIRHLICGAKDEDARAIGFDEGPKMQNWKRELEQRGISVETGVCRKQAAEVLQQYAHQSGNIYNGRQSHS